MGKQLYYYLYFKPLSENRKFLIFFLENVLILYYIFCILYTCHNRKYKILWVHGITCIDDSSSTYLVMRLLKNVIVKFNPDILNVNIILLYNMSNDPKFVYKHRVHIYKPRN